jgi:WD40 repeat protein
MRIRSAEFSRRLARLSAGMLLVPLGLLTCLLFFTTGGPVPREFLSVDQLGFETGRALFFLHENDARYYELLNVARHGPLLTLICPDKESPSREDEVSVRVLDSFTLQHVSTFRCKLPECGVLERGPDSSSAVSASRQGKLKLWDLGSGRTVSLEIEEPWRELGKAILSWHKPEFYFGPDGRHLLIQAHQGVIYYDLVNRRTLAVFQPRRHCEIMTCFFDTRGCPKVVVESNDLEIWDLSSNEFEIRLEESELEEQARKGGELSAGLGRRVATSSTRAATMFSQWDFLLIHSLEDGRLLQTHSIPSRGYHEPQFSPDGRFLIFDYLQSNQLFELPAGWHSDLYDWISARFPLRPRMALFDLHTGIIVLDLIGEGKCSINSDGTRLVSFTNEGRYEYDIPPRWQYFTPWAWMALCAWVSLAAIWWRLRKTRHRAVSVGVGQVKSGVGLVSAT